MRAEPNQEVLKDSKTRFQAQCKKRCLGGKTHRGGQIQRGRPLAPAEFRRKEQRQRDRTEKEGAACGSTSKETPQTPSLRTAASGSENSQAENVGHSCRQPDPICSKPDGPVRRSLDRSRNPDCFNPWSAGISWDTDCSARQSSCSSWNPLQANQGREVLSWDAD